MAVRQFQNRGYASLGGFILNSRNVKREQEKVQELTQDFHSRIIRAIPRDDLVTEAEELGMCVMEAFPDSEMADHYRLLASDILSLA